MAQTIHDQTYMQESRESAVTSSDYSEHRTPSDASYIHTLLGKKGLIRRALM